jgi:uncharacterized protein (DUF488 family)
MTLYTVGHSNQSFEEFAEMLQSQKIGVIVDVRSVPASKYTPQFNKEPLQIALKKIGIVYMSFAEEFGARRTDSLDENNNVNFEKAVKTEAFQRGFARVMKGLNEGLRISLMCSEANPLGCHRFAMVSRYFFEHGVDVQHIVKERSSDGSIKIALKSHRQLQDEMVADYVKRKKIPSVSPADLFGDGEITNEQQIVLAYRAKNSEIAYHQEPELEYEYL